MRFHEGCVAGNRKHCNVCVRCTAATRARRAAEQRFALCLLACCFARGCPRSPSARARLARRKRNHALLL